MLYDFTDYDIQCIRKILKTLQPKVKGNDSTILNRILSRCSDISTRRRSSLEYKLPTQTTLDAMAEDSHSSPSRYYSFRYFENVLELVVDDLYIAENNQLIKDTGSVYFHIKSVGFIPKTDLPIYYQSKLKHFSYHLIGNFEFLEDALKFYRRFICDLLLSKGVEGVIYGLF